TADGARVSGRGRSGWSDVLWNQLPGRVPARRRLCRQDSARREACRPPGRAADEVRSRPQSYDRQGARPDDPGGVPAARRGGDRMSMRRREFITLVGSVGAWLLAPHRAIAQLSDRVRRIAVLSGFAATDPEAQARIAALQQGLKELGWAEGRNLSIEFRWDP